MGLPLKPRRLLKLRRDQEGSAAVEFALCLIPLLLIVGGILDFGHLWYMQSVLATASREGARYATHYQSPKVNPNNLSPSIENYVLNTPAENGGSKGVGLTDLLSADATPAVIPGGPGYTTGTGSVSVQVTAKKYWFMLYYLIPGLTNPQLLSATTWMTCEY
jgi:Flp pilus assembly protein TadG